VGMVLCGFVFGFCMQKGQVVLPEVIANQFNLSSFIMLKMFVAAIAASLLSLSLYSMINPLSFEGSRSKSK